MTLPASGTISFYDLNIELGRSGTASIGLDNAENGDYGAINKCSSPFPASSNPASINEWYSYNHNASTTTIGVVDYSATSCAAACALNVAGVWTLYYNTAATAVYTDTTCNTYPSVGYHALLDRSNCYDIGSSGIVNSITACATTTTTTTVACYSFSIAYVSSLYDCYQGSYTNTVYSGCSTLANSCNIYASSNCTSPLSSGTYIQTNDGTNWEIGSGGAIVNSNNPGC